MKRSLLICIGSVALTLTTGAQMSDNQPHRSVPQRSNVNPRYRGPSALRQMVPQRTFSTARFRPSSFSTARFQEPTARSTRVQPHMSSLFVNRPATANIAPRERHLAVANDWRGSRFSPRPRFSDSFATRSGRSEVGGRADRRMALNDRWADSDFRERSRTSSSFLNRFSQRDAEARPETRQSFNNYWANSNFKNRLHPNSSFGNKSRSTAFWSGSHAGFRNNWSGSEFSGRQYWAFQNYQPQWHDSGWWDNCGDRIVFVTVYSQPFPFYFDAGYWYPAWGYYPDAYYPYDGPIYGYNGLPPDEIIENVQIELYNQGYYSGPIDGILGPDTQAAIADYQADHGLAVTAAIDEPIVESLGLT